jgi:hypothetical protein
VTFTIERCIVVYYPMKRYNLNIKKMSKKIVLSLLAFALITYAFAFVISGIERSGEKKAPTTTQCVVLEDWFQLAVYVTFLDMCLTIILPFMLILTMNVLIIVKLTRMTRFRGGDESQNSNQSQSQSQSQSQNIELLARNAEFIINAKTRRGQEIQARRKKQYKKTTRLLFAITTAFLIFHMPMAVKKIWYFEEFFSSNALTCSPKNCSTLANNSTLLGMDGSVQAPNILNNASRREEILERLASYIYYLNFPFNSFFYVLNSARLKNILLGRKSSI